MFQIPFGAEGELCILFDSWIALDIDACIEPADDILNFLLTIGSPVLAVYSLQITHLNARWLHKTFLDIDFPNSKTIPTVISAFHHVPIQIASHPPALPSLIVLPQNDKYWNILLRGAKKIRRWSIPLMMNFVWAVVATFLTIVGSFAGVPPGDIGYGTVAIWLYLLPLIIGWLHVGSEPEPNHLRECLETADPEAWVATDQSPELVEIIGGHQAFEFAKAHEVPSANKDELKTTPIFNYSRAFVWSQNAERVVGMVKNAASNAKQRIAVGSSGGERDPVWINGERGNMADDNRVGTAVQVTEYCMKGPPSHEPGTPKTSVQSPQIPVLHMGPRNSSRWATGVRERVALATTLALGLQWGITGGAIIIHYFARPVGLGCRATAFLLYTVLSTTSFFFFLASSILAHMSRPLPEQDRLPPRSLTFSRGAIICRRLGKIVGVISAIAILTVCFFQAAGLFDICWCNSTTLDRGRAYVVFHPMYVARSIISPFWIGGLAMASSATFLFGFSIYLGTPPRR
jgi:hypothetical protein